MSFHSPKSLSFIHCFSLKSTVVGSCALSLIFFGEKAVTEGELPNIVVMLADDMGYGEVQALNPKYGKIKTPELDNVVAEGLTFTDGHSGSAVCTPTRYGLITGRYAWRTKLQSSVLKGGNSLVAKETLTLADMLKERGYRTAMFGKWHLGMKFNGQTKETSSKINVGDKITEGPVDCGGFDEFYGFHHAKQMDTWIEHGKVAEKMNPIDMLPRLTKNAVNFINSRKGHNQPFFMYIPWNAPHAPVVPAKGWQGKSGINDHADFVMQTDWSYGQVVKALKKNGFWENSLVIYSADNGTSPNTSGLNQLTKAGHKPSAQFHGYKADIYEGGHRVPFLATWPKVIKPGTKSDSVVCLTDLMATFADITGYQLKPDEGVDSYSFLPILKGKTKSSRSDVIHHSVSGYFAIRKGKWKLCAVNGSGGWLSPKINTGKAKAAKKLSDVYQLFDMSQDEGEQTNLADQHPEIVKELRSLLDKQISHGRSTPGVKQSNDTNKIIVEKWGKGKKKSKK